MTNIKAEKCLWGAASIKWRCEEPLMSQSKEEGQEWPVR